MAKIKLLSEDVIRKIAAGEVIERPASVIKELLENSLDAGATSISVEVEENGRALIRVSDNGTGIKPEDVPLALTRHATSKIEHFEDLSATSSFGFRGEALASIAAVSRLEIVTKCDEAPEAWRVVSQAGKVEENAPASRARGTTVSVSHLFFNTPARAKFQKSDPTERRHILRVLEELALAHPQTAFELIVDKKSVLHSAQAQYEGERLMDLFGREFFEGLVPLSVHQRHATIKGFISKPDRTFNNRSAQYLFVNNRPVFHKGLQHAVYEGARDILMHEQHPAYVLFMEVDPQTVDVNVHPTKREVRLAQERPLHDLLLQTIKQAIHVETAIPALLPSSAEPESRRFDSVFTVGETPAPYHASPAASSPAVLETPQTLEHLTLEPLAQAHGLYVIAQNQQELFIVDQHAAAERVLFETFMENQDLAPVASQELLLPLSWNVTPQQATVIQSALKAFGILGFRIEEFGKFSFLVKALPAPLARLKDAIAALNTIVEDLLEDNNLKISWREKIATAACRAAVKANDPLTIPELQGLLQNLKKCKAPLTCPHGRPTMIRLPFAELARRFRRT